MQKMATDDGNTEQLEQWTELVFDQALVAEGSLPADPARLARAITKLMSEASDTEA